MADIWLTFTQLNTSANAKNNFRYWVHQQRELAVKPDGSSFQKKKKRKSKDSKEGAVLITKQLNFWELIWFDFFQRGNHLDDKSIKKYFHFV